MKRALGLALVAVMLLPGTAMAQGLSTDMWCRFYTGAVAVFMGDASEDPFEDVSAEEIQACEGALAFMGEQGIGLPQSGSSSSGDAFGPGIYIVGADIKPGTYRSTPVSGACLWKRLSGFGGSMDEVIEQDLVMEGQVIVTIKASDKGFDADDDCGSWTKVD